MGVVGVCGRVVLQRNPFEDSEITALGLLGSHALSWSALAAHFPRPNSRLTRFEPAYKISERLRRHCERSFLRFVAAPGRSEGNPGSIFERSSDFDLIFRCFSMDSSSIWAFSVTLLKRICDRKWYAFGDSKKSRAIQLRLV